jgi:hypothetical protein
MPKSTAAGVLPCRVPGGHHRTGCWPTAIARRPERPRRQRYARRRGEAAVYSGRSPVAAAPCLASGGAGRRPWSHCTLDSAGRARASLSARAEPKSTVFAAVGGPGRADCSTPLPPRGGAHRRRPCRSGPRNTAVSGGAAPGPTSRLRSWRQGRGPQMRSPERREDRASAGRGANDEGIGNGDGADADIVALPFRSSFLNLYCSW